MDFYELVKKSSIRKQKVGFGFGWFDSKTDSDIKRKGQIIAFEILCIVLNSMCFNSKSWIRWVLLKI